MVEVKINGLFLTQSQSSGVILKELSGDRTLPIIIGDFEAQSIALGLENIEPPRPISHDLILSIMDDLAAEVERIIISDLRNNTYYAIIQIRRRGKLHKIDARPSDAIALAVRKQTIRVFVEEDVMQKGAYNAEEIPDLDERQIVDTNQERVERLKKELDEAVEEEDYEKAAKLRDEIKRVESQQKT